MRLCYDFRPIWGWKTYPRMKKIFTQEFQDQKTKEPRTILFKKYKNQMKISLELTRKQAKDALKLLLLKKNSQDKIIQIAYK